MSSNQERNNSEAPPQIAGALTFPQSSTQNDRPLQIAGALTFPQPNPENARPLPVQPRQPRDLQGLLRFAMEATKAEDAPGNSNIGPMDEERRRFLEDAIRNLTVDVADVLQKSIKILTDREKIAAIPFGDTMPQEIQTAFDNLLEFIDQIDTANDFYKMGGFAAFPICLGSENEGVRASACDLLAELCQNNPFCQARTLECGLLSVLIQMAATERSLPVLTKTVYAMSCICRECEEACTALVNEGGCEVLCKLLGEDSAPIWIKVAFFTSYLCRTVPQAKEELFERGIIRILAEILKKGRSSHTEHVLSTLLGLVADLDPRILAQCRDPDLRLIESLQQYLQHPKLGEDTEFLEEREYCEDLLRILSTNNEIAEKADR